MNPKIKTENDKYVIEYLSKLLRLAKFETLSLIWNTIDVEKTLIKLNKQIIIEKFLYLLITKDVNSNYIRLVRFFRIIPLVSNNLIPITGCEIKELEEIIELICKSKTIVYWKKHGNDFIVSRSNLGNILKNDNSTVETIHLKTIEQNLGNNENKKSKSYVIINGKKINLLQSLKIHRFKSIYKLLCTCIGNDKKYCPWCYPDQTIEHTHNQRKCENCKEIEQFILSKDSMNIKQSKKNLGMKITRIKKKDLKTTISARGNALLKIVEKTNQLANVKNMSLETAQITKLIKSQFQLV